MPDNSNKLAGVLVINKPADLTSHDVVARVRKLVSEKGRAKVGLPAVALAKVGHTGTLDPFATGVLVVVVGRATRLIQYTAPWRKTYRAVVTLGATSSTDDRTGDIVSQPVSVEPTLREITAILPKFIGTISQVPPTYSAIKYEGRALYAYARSGQPRQAPAREVVVYGIKVLSYRYPSLDMAITCGSGTYIRALARDMGDALTTGAYVTELVRTANGPCILEHATALADLTAETISSHLLPSTVLVEHLPRATLSSDAVNTIIHGQPLAAEQHVTDGALLALFDLSETLIGVVKYDLQKQTIVAQTIIG